ncbi:MAG TPA: DUF4440 domain-containing protein, partial [Streptosporangiaceae bacterium]|nr:DUF4440 domain-containing protein [Streptosporangiaceae bacterium]
MVLAALVAVVLPAGGKTRLARAQVVPGHRFTDDRLQYQVMLSDGVTRLVEKWEAACNQQDPAAVAALYLRDAFIVSGTGSIVTGPPAIRTLFGRNLSRLRGLHLRLYEPVGSGALAYVTGYLTYEVNHPSGVGASYSASVPYSLALFQQGDGSWKIRAQTGGDFPASFVTDDGLREGMAPGESDSIRVRLTDAMGRPLRHSQVSFEVVYGGGGVSPRIAFTDTTGIAAALVTVGSQAGINAVVAHAFALPEEPL